LGGEFAFGSRSPHARAETESQNKRDGVRKDKQHGCTLSRECLPRLHGWRLCQLRPEYLHKAVGG
jgi:hypothetical protein